MNAMKLGGSEFIFLLWVIILQLRYDVYGLFKWGGAEKISKADKLMSKILDINFFMWYTNYEDKLMKNKEIELKFVINSQIKNEIIKLLEEMGEKKSESFLIDTYYIPNFKDFEINGETMECVRIRENEKGCVLTYKKIHREATPLYCDEFETNISSKHQMENILFALGFSVQMVIDKKRVSYSMGNLEFDFDSVKDLGELMEVELASENAEVEEIYEFVKPFGLSQKDVTYEGIQTLMKKAMKSK